MSVLWMSSTSSGDDEVIGDEKRRLRLRTCFWFSSAKRYTGWDQVFTSVTVDLASIVTGGVLRKDYLLGEARVDMDKLNGWVIGRDVSFVLEFSAHA